MIYNYVLINTIDVNEREIEHVLKKHPHIIEINPTIVENTAMADPLFENFNIIAKVKGETKEDIKHIVDSELIKIPGVNNIKIYSKPNIE